MQSDWIKMRTDLYRDPKVIGMADHLMSRDGQLARHVGQMCQRDMAVTRNVTRCAVVGGLVSVWGVLRHRGTRVGDDLLVPNCSDAVLDDIADMPGFGEAMCSVGWAVETEGGVVLPKFFRDLNAEPIKSSAADRQKRYRDRLRNGDVTRDGGGDVTSRVTVTGEKRERERREEEEKTPPNPPQAGARADRPPAKKFDPLAADLPHKSPAFAMAWAEWVKHRSEKRESLTPTTTTKQLKALGELPEQNAIDCIGRSIASGWTGLFPDNHRGTATPPRPPTGFKTKAEKDAEYFAQQMAYAMNTGTPPQDPDRD